MLRENQSALFRRTFLFKLRYDAVYAMLLKLVCTIFEENELTNIDVLFILKSENVEKCTGGKRVMNKEQIVAVFKAFSDESRVEILALLKDGELCGNDLLEKMEISQSTLSHHMKILCESGIVNGRKVGKWTYYSISEDGGAEAKVLLDQILDAKTTKAQPKTENVKKETKKTASRKKSANKTVAPKAEEAMAEPVKEEPKKEEPAVETPPKTEVRRQQRRQMDSWLL